MLRELITYFTTSCPPYVRRMGYLYQAIALRGRYVRRHRSWQPHLDNTQKFIIQCAERCHNREKAVVLGSGLLLDIPLEKLSKMFGEMVLADVIHLPEVCKRVKRFANVRLTQCDVTGIAEKLFQNVQSGFKELPVSVPSLPEIDESTGLVISLNILSQLAAIPFDYVQKKMPLQDESVIDAWCDQMREAHYSALKALPCNVCLVADFEFVRKDSAGKVVEKGSTVGGLALPAPDTAWTWEIAPLGEDSRDRAKGLHVGAWHIRRG